MGSLRATPRPLGSRPATRRRRPDRPGSEDPGTPAASFVGPVAGRRSRPLRGPRPERAGFPPTEQKMGDTTDDRAIAEIEAVAAELSTLVPHAFGVVTALNDGTVIPAE